MLLFGFFLYILPSKAGRNGIFSYKGPGKSPCFLSSSHLEICTCKEKTSSYINKTKQNGGKINSITMGERRLFIPIGVDREFDIL